jgi:hypothetical protein
VGRDAYPVAGDLTAFLSEAGVVLNTTSARDAALAAGIQAFETACSRHFLAGKAIDNTDQGSQTRYFDPPVGQDGVLWFGAWNDLAVPAASGAVVYQPSSAGSPTTFALNTDYWFEPRNNPAIGKPYTHMRMLRRWRAPNWGSLYNAIQITGLWGYSTSIPDDAWLAMLQSAALWVEGQHRLAVTGGGNAGFAVTGGVSFQFGTDYTTIVKRWQGKVDAAVATYRRVEA